MDHFYFVWKGVANILTTAKNARKYLATENHSNGHHPHLVYEISYYMFLTTCKQYKSGCKSCVKVSG